MASISGYAKGGKFRIVHMNIWVNIFCQVFIFYSIAEKFNDFSRNLLSKMLITITPNKKSKQFPIQINFCTYGLLWYLFWLGNIKYLQLAHITVSERNHHILKKWYRFSFKFPFLMTQLCIQVLLFLEIYPIISRFINKTLYSELLINCEGRLKLLGL